MPGDARTGPRADRTGKDIGLSEYLRGILPPGSALANALYQPPPAFAGTGDPGDFDTVAQNPWYAYVRRGRPEGGPPAMSVYGTSGADWPALDLSGQARFKDLTMFTGSGGDTLDFSAMKPSDEALAVVYSGSGDDLVIGPPTESSALFGGSGSDTIVARGTSANRIAGGYGADRLVGSGGRDQFAYYSARDTGDTVTGFTSGEDVFLLVGLGEKRWQGELAGRGAVEAGGIGWTPGSNGGVTVYVDTDGAAGADLVVNITGVSSVKPSDFVYLR